MGRPKVNEGADEGRVMRGVMSGVMKRLERAAGSEWATDLAAARGSLGVGDEGLITG